MDHEPPVTVLEVPSGRRHSITTGDVCRLRGTVPEMGTFRNDRGTGEIRREMEIKAFRVACGEFVGFGDLDRKEWERPGMALVPRGVPYAVGMFAVRARGRSMEPMIRNRWWCLFHPDVVGTRQSRIVLVEDQSEIGGDRYTLKKFHSHKIY